MPKFNDEDGVWRTVGGRRVFIKNGQDLASAMKESGKFKKLKDIEHQQRKINNELAGLTGEDKQRADEEYDAYEKLKNNQQSGEVDKKKPIHKLGQTNETDEKINLDSKEVNDKLQETKRKADEWRIQHGEKPVFTDKEKGLDWRDQIKSNNEKLERDLADYQKTHDMRYDNEGYYELFRENERRNAKIKKEVPTEKYENVQAYAGYKDKFKSTWGEDGSGDKTVSAKMYTNDEFMEHLEDANWHGERRQLLDANLTNQELSYIKDRTNVSAWGVENLNGKEQVDNLIKEAKSKFGVTKINDNVMNSAYLNYLKDHPDSKITLNDFKKWFK